MRCSPREPFVTVGTGVMTGDDHRRVERSAEIDKAPGGEGAREYFAERGVADPVDNSLHEQGAETARVSQGGSARGRARTSRSRGDTSLS